MGEKKRLIIIKNSECIEDLKQTLLRVGKQEKIDSPFINFTLDCLT